MVFNVDGRDRKQNSRGFVQWPRSAQRCCKVSHFIAVGKIFNFCPGNAFTTIAILSATSTIPVWEWTPSRVHSTSQFNREKSLLFYLKNFTMQLWAEFKSLHTELLIAPVEFRYPLLFLFAMGIENWRKINSATQNNRAPVKYASWFQTRRSMKINYKGHI